jgi:hypothetical protein
VVTTPAVDIAEDSAMSHPMRDRSERPLGPPLMNDYADGDDVA